MLHFRTNDHTGIFIYGILGGSWIRLTKRARPVVVFAKEKGVHSGKRNLLVSADVTCEEPSPIGGWCVLLSPFVVGKQISVVGVRRFQFPTTIQLTECVGTDFKALSNYRAGGAAALDSEAWRKGGSD